MEIKNINVIVNFMAMQAEDEPGLEPAREAVAAIRDANDDGFLDELVSRMLSGLTDEDDEDEDGTELVPAHHHQDDLQRILRNVVPGGEVSWLGRSWGYRVRKITSSNWAVVDPDTHDRLDEDEAHRWYYFNCGQQSVVDQGAMTGLGAGVVNNGQLARILMRSDVQHVYLIHP